MLTYSTLRTDTFLQARPARPQETPAKIRAIRCYQDEPWYYDLQPILMATD